MKKIRLGFIGVGSMAGSMIRGILSNQFPDPIELNLFNRSRNDNIIEFESKANIHQNIKDLIIESDFIFLGTKPVDLTNLLKSIAVLGLNLKDKIFVSMAAGYKAVNIEHLLKTDRIVRIMPNTPITVGKGVTGIYLSPQVMPEEKSLLIDLLTKISTVVVHPEESGINDIIAVSGSGSAYFFHIFNAIAESAQNELNFSKDEAECLVLETAAGAVELAKRSNKSFLELQQDVTSKKGTTEAALNKFMEQGLAQIISSGMIAAKKRSQEMEQQLDITNEK